MIRVFFNIRLDDAYLPERTGQWVEDEAEARDLARIIVRRLVADHGGEQRLLNAELAVTGEGGASLFDVSFFEALYVPVAAPGPVAEPLRSVATIRPRPRLASLLGSWRAQALALAAAWRPGGGLARPGRGAARAARAPGRPAGRRAPTPLPPGLRARGLSRVLPKRVAPRRSGHQPNRSTVVKPRAARRSARTRRWHRSGSRS